MSKEAFTLSNLMFTVSEFYFYES
ncbi:hypothetical protein Pint_14758 [Pistacia integerrima]|uniref:Uncharacterized protein n=1 Tax=Pistacia integerrima TaxID=434235 RepID=A0ACC0Y6P0_9ROSI|nr:hypothetical protein Pint_14758 [Pistacia integerrima]